MEIQNKQTLRNLQPALQQAKTTTLRTQHGKINTHKAIIDKKTKRHINVVSQKYTLVQHREVIQSVLNALDKENVDVTGQITGEQDKMRITLLIDEPSYKIRDKSTNTEHIKFGFRAVNSYDSSTSLYFEAFGFREKCSNGMFLGQELLASKKKYHTGEITVESMTQNVVDILKVIKEERGTVKDLFEDMMTTSITKEKAFKELDDMFRAKKHVDNILRRIGVTVIRVQEENGEEQTKLIEEDSFKTVTLWDLYNAFTNYATHSENISTNTEDKVQRQAQVLLRRVPIYTKKDKGERE